MLHDAAQIRSLQEYIENQMQDRLPYDKLMNAWIRENAIQIQDADTIDYYIALIPMIERRRKANAV